MFPCLSFICDVKTLNNTPKNGLNQNSMNTYEYPGVQWFNAFGREQIWLFKADNIYKMTIKGI